MPALPYYLYLRQGRSLLLGSNGSLFIESGTAVRYMQSRQVCGLLASRYRIQWI